MKHTFTLLLSFLFVALWAQCESLEIDRTGWSVHSVDTEETNGEGPNNGRAIHTIDNNNNTFWHTRWQNYTAEFPHFISIDMGAVYPINGLSIRSRHDNPYNKAKGYELYLSLDGENWEPLQAAGDLIYPNPNETGQTAFFDFGAVNAQYFKLIFNTNYSNDNHVAISEIKATQISGEGCSATGQNNQVLVFDEIEQHYTTDSDFELSASSNTSSPIQYEVVSGPATVSGNTLSLTGEGGVVEVRAYQEESTDYYLSEVFRSFDVVDLSTIQPEIITRITSAYPIEMPSLYAYKLTASSTIAEEDALSVTHIEFYVNGELLETEEGNNSYFAWWTPSEYGTHNIEIKSYASNGMIQSLFKTVEVTNTINTREITTLQNAIIDFGSIGSQWYYGTYEMPQFVGAYDQILAEFNVTCPNVPGGCDDWDRLGYLQIKNPDGEWVELIRYITPYGVACEHELDITDFASLLQGEVEFRMYIETWGTGGWELELKLHYYQGTPEYRYSEIEEVWNGTYNFGDLANLQPVPQATINAPLSTEEASFRVVTTGHGWGANNTGNAAEFYYANHHFNVNGMNTFDQSMRVTCNPNPDGCTGQMGTWYHARAGWCPGAIAKPYLYDLTPHIGESFAFDYEFELDYVDYCHPNNPECVSGVTCADCNDGYNPHYRIGAYAVYKSNNPLGVLSTKEVQPVIDNKLIVLPNPSNGIFKVYLENEMQKLNLQIYDTNGTAIKRYTFNNETELNSYTFNVENLPSGVYFIKVYNEKQMAATKFIIK